MESIFNKFSELIFKKKKNSLRYTQDSPIYPSVWLEYLELAIEDDKDLFKNRVDLIVTPHRNYTANELLVLIKESLNEYFKSERIKNNVWRLSTNGETVAVECTLSELIYCLLPNTYWFKKSFKDDVDDNQKWISDLLGFLIAIDNKNTRSSLFSEKDLKRNYQENFEILNNFKPMSDIIWSISLNRKAKISLFKSVKATKADAARRLFDIDTSRITWAVLDTGIDATHEAFKIEGDNDFSSRIIATYDFTNFRELIAGLNTADDQYENDEIDRQSKMFIGALTENNKKALTERTKVNNLRDINKALKSGRMIDWSLIAPLLQIPHNKSRYVDPEHPHGTHVAGIIGANWKNENSSSKSIVGVCPDINLYDIRVLDKNGVGEEFNIIAAIQFVRWLNRQKDQLLVHGINLSLSIIHEVESFACGQTPVCSSCARLIAEGTVIVCAAGNHGQALFESPSGQKEQGFRSVNITDPGNTEDVITVGSTHRNKPHTYGISYFSSRGPTGDGRYKPDLVAPGEKIVSTTPGNNSERMDGTSMAAPHVSGAAALLLANNRELIGNPKMVKKVICQSATDLNRERYFQGHGMLDTLRALQSI